MKRLSIVLMFILCKENKAASVLLAPAEKALTTSCESEKKRTCMPWFGIGYAQGKRPTMEDVHSIMFNRSGIKLFGLYDGHAGSEISTYLGEALHGSFMESFENSDHGADQSTDAILEASLIRSFLKTDKQAKQLRKEGIIKDNSGSCALVSVLYKAFLGVAHAGDSRAVFYSGGKIVFVSSDHTPSRFDERARLRQELDKTGGAVTSFGSDGPYRIICNTDDPRVGCPSMSRGLGEIPAFENIVIPDPEVSIIPLDKGDTDSFLIMACDGVWDVLSNDDAVVCVKDFLEKHPGNMQGAAQCLKDLALKKRSKDNITVLIIDTARYLMNIST